MRMTLLPLAAVLCSACGTKQVANRPDSTAPAAAVSADSSSATSTAELRHFIDSAQARYSEAVVKGDVQGMSSVYTDDAVVIAPNSKAFHGRAEIDSGNARTLPLAKFTGLKLRTEDLQVVGDVGIETGTYEQTLKPEGKTLHDNGSYLAVWKKQANGGWKIYRLAYDSELPAPKS